MGANSPEDERKFAAAARVSEINLGLYKTLVQPWVRLWANEGMAEWMQRMHPARLQYEIFGQSNPLWRNFDTMLESVQKNRQPVDENNPYWQMQKAYSDWMTQSLDAYRDVRDRLQEEWFHAFYGSPIVQALAGLKGRMKIRRPKPGDDAAYRLLVQQRIEELRHNIAAGGPLEAAVRALIYIRMPEGSVDERSFTLLRRLREEAGKGMSLRAFKQLLREQFFMLLIDQPAALDAIPAMLEKDPDLAEEMEGKLHRVVNTIGLQTNEAKSRLGEIEGLFNGVPVRGIAKPREAEVVKMPTPPEHPRPRRKH